MRVDGPRRGDVEAGPPAGGRHGHDPRPDPEKPAGREDEEPAEDGPRQNGEIGPGLDEAVPRDQLVPRHLLFP